MRSTFSHIKLFYSKGIWNWISGKKNLNPSDAIIIASDPRSGSTWLSEIISSIPGSFIIDEPLHLNNVKEIKHLNFSWRQHIPREKQWPAAKSFFKKLFKGQILNPHIVKNYKNAVKAKQPIIKTIRAKLLLPWLCNQFEFKYKPIVLVRHPFAMIASLKRHEAFDYPFERFTLPNSKYTDFLLTHLDFLKTLNSNQEQQLAWWCLSNKYLASFDQEDWIVVTYEELVNNYKETVEHIFSTWKTPLPKSILKVASKASSSTTKRKFQKEEQLNSWQDILSDNEIARYNEILNYFNVDYFKLYQN